VGRVPASQRRRQGSRRAFHFSQIVLRRLGDGVDMGCGVEGHGALG